MTASLSDRNSGPIAVISWGPPINYTPYCLDIFLLVLIKSADDTEWSETANMPWINNTGNTLLKLEKWPDSNRMKFN